MRKAERDKQEIDKQIIIDFKSTFASPEGKRVLDHLMNICTIAKPSVSVRAGSVGIDTSRLLFDEGQRCFMLHIMNRVNADPMKTLPEDAITERT